MSQKEYETYIFHSISAPEVKYEIEDLIKSDPYTTERDFPNLIALILDQVDVLLEKCYRKGKDIFHNNAIDLDELEAQAGYYFEEELKNG